MTPKRSRQQLRLKAQSKVTLLTTNKMPSPFATAFRYSRFDSVSAKPRSVDDLTGFKHRIQHQGKGKGVHTTTF
jgi:hypothetical protein